MIHHGLEGSRGVGKSKEHYQWFEQSPIGAECCLPFIAVFHVDVVTVTSKTVAMFGYFGVSDV